MFYSFFPIDVKHFQNITRSVSLQDHPLIAREHASPVASLSVDFRPLHVFNVFHILNAQKDGGERLFAKSHEEDE